MRPEEIRRVMRCVYVREPATELVIVSEPFEFNGVYCVVARRACKKNAEQGMYAVEALRTQEEVQDGLGLQTPESMF